MIHGDHNPHVKVIYSVTHQNVPLCISQNSFMTFIQLPYPITISSVADAVLDVISRVWCLQNLLENCQSRTVDLINVCIEKLQSVNEVAQIAASKSFHQVNLKWDEMWSVAVKNVNIDSFINSLQVHVSERRSSFRWFLLWVFFFSSAQEAARIKTLKVVFSVEKYQTIFKLFTPQTSWSTNQS